MHFSKIDMNVQDAVIVAIFRDRIRKVVVMFRVSRSKHRPYLGPLRTSVSSSGRVCNRDCANLREVSSELQAVSFLSLPCDVISETLSKLDLANRLKVRLVCKSLCMLTPSPWELASDILDGVNAFNVCMDCGSKGFDNCTDNCMIKGDRLFHGNSHFSRCDPRRLKSYTNHYSNFARDIQECNANFCNSSGRGVFCNMMSPKCNVVFEQQIEKHARKIVVLSNWASKNLQYDKTSPFSKFRQLFAFMTLSINRLADHHLRIIRSILQTGKRRYKHLPADFAEEFSEIHSLRKQSPLRYQIIFALASLRLSITELFGGCHGGIIRWRNDYITSCGLRFQNETPRSEFQDSSFDHCVRTDIQIELYADFGMADLYRCCPCCLDNGSIVADKNADLFGVKPGSRKHFEYLLRPMIHPCLTAVFGQEFCLKHFNATKRVSDMLERIFSRLQALEGNVLDCDDFGEIQDLKDDDSLMSLDSDELEDEWITDEEDVDETNNNESDSYDDGSDDYTTDYDDYETDYEDDAEDGGNDSNPYRQQFLESMQIFQREAETNIPEDLMAEFHDFFVRMIRFSS
jgi:hypothetical protein